MNIYGAVRVGWKCPVCGAGVHPDKDKCEHTNIGISDNNTPPWTTTGVPPSYTS